MSENDYPLPPATFEFFIASLKMQTEMHLGLLRFGQDDSEDQPPPDLRLARHSIDLIAMIQEKTKGNLSLEEQRAVENGLTELRFRYVQILERTKKEQAEPKLEPEQPKVEPSQPEGQGEA